MEPDIVGTVKAGAGVEPKRRMITESKSQQPLKLTPILVHPDPLISQLNGAALNICMYSGGDDQTVCDAFGMEADMETQTLFRLLFRQITSQAQINTSSCT